MVEFRVLGSLDILRDGRGVPLPAPAEQALLAVLLLNPGRTVAADILIDALWESGLPARPANALQHRVSKLRRALTEAGLVDGLLLHRPPGYRFDVDPVDIDAHRFAVAVGQARKLADVGAPGAARSYEEALALWRGPALAGIDNGWIRREAARLDELHIAATEEWIALALASGRHADLVGELESLVAAHPLREKLHEQLILTLYRSGRQADALAVYRRTRVRLAEELGIDPSPALRELEQAILRQDPHLDSPGAARRTPPLLPARTASLVGRSAERERTTELLGRHRLVTLTGPGGVGKTTVALDVAARVAPDHPDGVWLVRLAGLTEPERLVRAVADVLGCAEDDMADEALVRLLRERTALLVLDNCEHLVDECAALVGRLLAACPSLRVLTTSREALAVTGEAQLPVPPLAIPPADTAVAALLNYDAVRLFVDRARAARPDLDLDSASASHVAGICRALDGIPLAIELAAALVRALPVDEIERRLDDRFRLLAGGARVAEARHRTLEATLDWSHQLLTGAERTLFRRLAVFRGGWTVTCAERVCAGGGLEAGTILGLLVRLVDRSLVVVDHAVGGRFRMLETVRQYAFTRLTKAGEVEHIAQAHAEDVVDVVERAEAELRGAARPRWLRWLRHEDDNIRAAQLWCTTHARSHPELGLRLVAALGWFSYFASRSSGAQEIADMLTAAAGGSPQARARALQALSLAGRPSSCVVHPSGACARAAQDSLTVFEASGSTLRAAYSRTLLAVQGVAGTDLAGAEALLAKADTDFARHGDRWGQALVSFVRMETQYCWGDPGEADRYGESAVSIFRELDDHWGVSAVHFHRGMALHRSGRLHEARRVYEAALAAGGQSGMANTVQYALAQLGHLTMLLGDHVQAAARFAEAHAEARALGAEGNPLAGLGEARLARLGDDLDTAESHYRNVIRMVEGRDEPLWTAMALTGLGFVAEQSEDPDTAEEHHLAAWAITSRTPGAEGDGAASLEGLACVAAGRGQAQAAARLLGAAAGVRDRYRHPANSIDRLDIERAANSTSAVLGARVYEHALASGREAGPPMAG